MQPTETPQSTVRARLQIRARRVGLIRRRVAATVLATFALAFGVIWQTGSVGAAAPTAAVASVTVSRPTSATANTTVSAVTTAQS